MKKKFSTKLRHVDKEWLYSLIDEKQPQFLPDFALVYQHYGTSGVQWLASVIRLRISPEGYGKSKVTQAKKELDKLTAAIDEYI